MKRRPRFALRTIRPDGSVVIFGEIYKPDESATRFAGTRAAFGIYYTGGERDRSLVSLWGTEDLYRCRTEEEAAARGLWPGPFVDENGYFRWEWWHQVAA